VSSPEPAAPADLARLLARDYWLTLSAPGPGTDQAAIDAHVREHIACLPELERKDVLVASGPLLSGRAPG
jgi:hypothetical protein